MARCDGRGVQLHNGERCLGRSAKASRQISGRFEMDLQDKYDADDSVEKYKAKFVAKGYAQKEGIDYEETFASVARYTSIRTVISLVAQMGWEIHQMDVKTMFVNGVIEEEVYIEQRVGFETHEKKSHVCRLKKALYGLKQGPRAWYGRIDGYL